jgi:two-component system, OmpR family, sensor histidine kinase SenX3
VTLLLAVAVAALVGVALGLLLARHLPGADGTREEVVAAERPQAARPTELSRLRGALDAVAQGVVVSDGAGQEVFRNRVAAAYVRGRHGEAVVEQAIQEHLGRTGSTRGQRRTLEIYGPPRRVLVVAAFPLEDREATGTVVVVDDVSERVRLEAVRRDFVANLSHELKTPVGALGLLADTIAAEDDVEVVGRLAERMTAEAVRVGRIIDDLLDLSRIEAGESPAGETLDVAEVVGEALERVRTIASARNIDLDAGDAFRRLTVTGDRRQLVAALANLLENACQYSDTGSRVEVRAWDDGSFVEIAVRDHGIGIPGRDLERVFERFYRVDRARSRETGGTGLGLSIVRHVATNHGGQVRVASREGEGSVFTVRLPAGPGPAPGDRVADQERRRQRSPSAPTP